MLSREKGEGGDEVLEVKELRMPIAVKVSIYATQNSRLGRTPYLLWYLESVDKD
jgi:hypothetical protein